MKVNHNLLALVLPLLVAQVLGVFVYLTPDIGLAPEETALKVWLRIAIFMAAWPLALQFLAGLGYDVIENAKAKVYGLEMIAVAIIVGLALVIAK
jgi:hypothetical protein